MATKAEMDAMKKEMLAEINAEAKKIMDEARNEAKEIIKNAGNQKEMPYRETAEELARANEPVKIRLFKDKDKYNAPVMVILNGESWLIKRGVDVEVPRKVANVLANESDQMGVAADIISGYEDDFEKAKDRLE